MSDPDLCYLGAREAAAAFRARRLSPVEVMAALIARADAVEPAINALPLRFFDEAMAAARAAEARFARGDPATLGPLEGIAVAVKASSDIAGQGASRGSLLLADAVAGETSALNERVMGAGAIVHARSAAPEFSCITACHSRLWGVTRNPWNPAFTPGGSSGGAGACLAAGTATLATGSDIGGSIRVPASCSGVVGYKPPYGRNPGDPPFNLDPYCHTGPMGRSVGDVALLQNVMAGPDPRDIATLRERLRVPEEAEPVRGLKVAYSLDLGLFDLDPAVRANTLAALDVFRDMGAVVSEVDPGFTPALLEAAMAHLVHIFGASIAPLLAEGADLMSDYARAFAELGAASTPADYLASLTAEAAAWARFAPVIEPHDVFICPTTALPAIGAGPEGMEDVRIAGEPVHPVLGWVMTTPFNALSRCPVLAVPSGFSPDCVPTGIQIVGRSYCDQDVFRAGLAYEAELGGWYGAPGARPMAGAG